MDGLSGSDKISDRELSSYQKSTQYVVAQLYKGTIKKIMISKDRMHKIAELKMFNNPAAIRTVIVIKYEKGKNYEQELQKLNS